MRTSPLNIAVANERVSMEVEFESSSINNTQVSWQFSRGTYSYYLPITAYSVTLDSNSGRFTTSVKFDPARRVNSGQYEVIINNTAPGIVVAGPFILTVRGTPLGYVCTITTLCVHYFQYCLRLLVVLF